MLTIYVGATELFDEEKNEFYLSTDGPVIQLEHSLVNLSKWESKWKKPFLGKDEKTHEEVLDYVRCTIVTPGVPDDIVYQFSNENLKQFNEYINDPMTATWFNELGPSKRNHETITNELIYHWMGVAGISIEAENWHLNRLITLIRIYSAKSEKPKKMSRAEALRQQRELNAKRRAEYASRG